MSQERRLLKSQRQSNHRDDVLMFQSLKEKATITGLGENISLTTYSIFLD